ncbi:hypothetical protein DBV23_00415 [Edwardsiella ictaluri]|nr:hypothetical protein DBV23_00415 [Edwardsiella ictaluri]KMQ79547.1 hypothetical protein ABY58_02335 [Edwardsiella ictaluri]KOO56174.1 hypothetical protein ACS33_02920 [Edwardsiella ictaluri]
MERQAESCQLLLYVKAAAATVQIASTMPDSPYPIIHGGGGESLKPACYLFVIFITKAIHAMYQPHNLDQMMLIYC